MWYRSPTAYDEKFGRALQAPAAGSISARALTVSGGGGVGAHNSYAVECYLDYQGEKFVDRFDANCYVSLTRTLDSHDVGRGRGGVTAVLATVRTRVESGLVAAHWPARVWQTLCSLSPWPKF